MDNRPVLPFSPSLTRDNFVFTSGQIYLTKEGKLLEGTIEEQTKQVMENLKEVLEKAGVSFQDVVKATIYTTEMSLYKRISDVYATYFSKPYPARVMVGVKELPLRARLEISLVARKPKK